MKISVRLPAFMRRKATWFALVLGLGAAAVCWWRLPYPTRHSLDLPENPKPNGIESIATKIKLEIRRSEISPTNGYTEAVLRGTSTKLFISPSADILTSDISKILVEPGARPALSLKFTEEGKAKYEKLAAEHLGKQLAIFINDVLVSAPVVKEAVKRAGGVLITGQFSHAEAERIVKGFSSPIAHVWE